MQRRSGARDVAAVALLRRTNPPDAKGAAVSYDQFPDRPVLGRTLIALSLGVGLAAIVLAAVAIVLRAPDGLISDRLTPVTWLLTGSLALIVLLVGALAGIARLVLAGWRASGGTVMLLMATSPLTAYAFLSATPRRYAAPITGVGAHPVLDYARASWLLLTVAVLLLMAGVFAMEQRQPAPRKATLRRAPPGGGGGARGRRGGGGRWHPPGRHRRRSG